MFRFYGFFAAAYGTLWIVLVLYALMTRSHVNTGEFGLYGFPLIALLYAVLRSIGNRDLAAENRGLTERIRRLETELMNRPEN